MPWWAILYLIIFVPFTGYAIWLDVEEKKPWWRFLAETAACLIEILMFVGVFIGAIGTALGLAVIPMLVYAVCWDIFSMRRGFSDEKPEGATTRKDRFIICVGLGLLILPTYVAGIVLSVRAITAV